MKSLLSGHEVQLTGGAFGTLSEQILRLFTEVKRKQNQQLQDLDNIQIVSYYFLYISENKKNKNKRPHIHFHRLCLIRLKKNLLFVFVVKLHMRSVLVVLNFYGM